jgi:hypothetical protein
VSTSAIYGFALVVVSSLFEDRASRSRGRFQTSLGLEKIELQI